MAPRKCTQKKGGKKVVNSKTKKNLKNLSEQPTGKSTEGPRMMTGEELDAELDLTL